MRARELFLIVGCSTAAVLVVGGPTSRWLDGLALHAGAKGQPKVRVGFRYIRYSEGDDCLELDWEPTSHGNIAYVPSERLWKTIMPDWAMNRRDEIMRSIKAETTHMKFVWQEYDRPGVAR